MHKKLLVVLIAIWAAAAFTGTAGEAHAGDYKNYGMVGIGINNPTGGLDDSGYDAGFASWVTYGRMIGANLAIEGTLDVFFTDQDLSGTTSVAGYYTREDFISTSALLVTLKGQIPVGSVMLFAGVGIGGYHVYLDSEIETSTFGDFDVDDDDTVLGAHVILGATWDLTARFFLGGQGMYRWTDDVKIDKQVGTVPVRLEGDLDGYTVTVSGGFRF